MVEGRGTEGSLSLALTLPSPAGGQDPRRELEVEGTGETLHQSFSHDAGPGGCTQLLEGDGRVTEVRPGLSDGRMAGGNGELPTAGPDDDATVIRPLQRAYVNG